MLKNSSLPARGSTYYSANISDIYSELFATDMSHTLSVTASGSLRDIDDGNGSIDFATYLKIDDIASQVRLDELLTSLGITLELTGAAYTVDRNNNGYIDQGVRRRRRNGGLGDCHSEYT
jgi:hypothetical protein